MVNMRELNYIELKYSTYLTLDLEIVIETIDVL